VTDRHRHRQTQGRAIVPRYYYTLSASFPGQPVPERQTSLDLNEARDDGVLRWQWHQLDHMQTICTSLQTDNHTNTPPPRHSVLPAGCSSWRRTDSVKANILPLSLVGPFDVVGPVGICLWLSHNPILPALTLTHDLEF